MLNLGIFSKLIYFLFLNFWIIIKNKINKIVFNLMSTFITYSNIPKYKTVKIPKFILDIVLIFIFFI